MDGERRRRMVDEIFPAKGLQSGSHHDGLLFVPGRTGRVRELLKPRGVRALLKAQQIGRGREWWLGLCEG